MPEVNLSGQFQPTQGAATSGSACSLPALLGTVAGVQIVDDTDLNQNLKQSGITVVSVFRPNACTTEAPPAATVPGGSTPGGSGPQPPGGSAPNPPGGTQPKPPGGTQPNPPAPGNGNLHFEGGGGHVIAHLPPAEARIATSLREKLVLLGSTFNELLALLDRPDGLAPGANVVMRAPQGDPKCWRYQHTEHGPTGLFRSRELLKVRVSGMVQMLGGLETADASLDYLMYLEYSVNTYLAGKPAWTLNAATQDADFDSQVVLRAVNGCYGSGAKVDGLKSCGSDTVSDVLRVVVNFKKVIIGQFTANMSTLTGGGKLDAYVARMKEQSFSGVMPFTHTMGATP